MLSLAPDICTVPGMLVGRVYVLRDPDGFTLVDTGPWGRTAHLLRQLARGDIAPTSIKRVVLTHDHADHTGGLEAVLRASGAELITSPVTVNHLSSRVRALASYVHSVTDGMVRRDVLGGMTVLETPGHRPGHISLWHPERGVLIAGDAVMRGWLARASAWLAHDRSQLAYDLDRLARLAPTLVLPGHGAALRRGAGVWLASRAAAIRGAR